MVDTRWFQEKIRDKGTSQRRLAKLMDLDPASLSNMLNGKRKMEVREAATLATLLGHPLEEVLTRAGVQVGQPREGTVPIIGVLNAALELTSDKSAGRRVAVPEEMTDNAAAVRVEDTNSALYGWTFFFDLRDGVASDCVDRLCYVRLADDKTMVRIVRRGLDSGQFSLVSVNGDPVISAKVASASPIGWIKT